MIKRRKRKSFEPFYDPELKCYCFPLTESLTALVDEEDHNMLRDKVWRAYKSRNLYYARAKVWNGKGEKEDSYRMHRLILNASKYEDVDHINGNGLDNRRCNLRLVTKQQNALNKSSYQNSMSGFKGVVRREFASGAVKWRAIIQINKKQKHLGYYDSPELAAKAYNDAATNLHGQYARLNMPRTII